MFARKLSSIQDRAIRRESFGIFVIFQSASMVPPWFGVGKGRMDDERLNITGGRSTIRHPSAESSSACHASLHKSIQ